MVERDGDKMTGNGNGEGGKDGSQVVLSRARAHAKPSEPLRQEHGDGYSLSQLLFTIQ